MKVPVDQIVVNPKQPRTIFDQEDLKNLAASIREYGIILPIPVRAVNGQYQLIDGERRWRAAILAGLAEVPVEVREASDSQMLEIALVANLHRTDLNPLEEGQAYQALIDGGLSLDEICERMGVRIDRVRARLKVLELDEPIKKLIAEEKLPPSEKMARALLSVPDQDKRLEIARWATRPDVTVGMVRQQCKYHKDRLQIKAENDMADPPAMRYAKRREVLPRFQMWDSLLKKQLVPPWEIVEAAARRTCEDCALSDVASEKVCQECPAVMMVGAMLKMTMRGRSNDRP